MRMYQGHRGAGRPESFKAAEDAEMPNAEMPRMLEMPGAAKNGEGTGNGKRAIRRTKE